jgi:hypothetical protein
MTYQSRYWRCLTAASTTLPSKIRTGQEENWNRWTAGRQGGSNEVPSSCPWSAKVGSPQMNGKLLASVQMVFALLREHRHGILVDCMTVV